MEKLIFDRILKDIIEKTQKGYYNVSDITRINSYIRLLSDELGLSLNVVDMIVGEEFTNAKMQDILDNINKIRAVWYVADDTPATPAPFNWDYNKANDVEKILQALYDFVVSRQHEVVYSGTFVAGNQIVFRG